MISPCGGRVAARPMRQENGTKCLSGGETRGRYGTKRNCIQSETP